MRGWLNLRRFMLVVVASLFTVWLRAGEVLLLKLALPL